MRLKFILKIKGLYHKDLLHSTGKELCSVSCDSLDGRGVWGQNGNMHMCGWVFSLFTWNCYNIIYRLYPIQNKKLKINQSNHYAAHIKKNQGTLNIKWDNQILVSIYPKEMIKEISWRCMFKNAQVCCLYYQTFRNHLNVQ